LTNSEQIAHYALLPLSVESELGRRNMSVREILSLAPGSLIKLPRPVGSTVELFVGGARFGSGEVIRSGRSAAVRITAFETKKRDG
jgi:flagellar motor switch protein FliN/FliY